MGLYFCPLDISLSFKKTYMMRNLIGYFAGGSDCRQMSVKIIANSASSVFEEIHLAGDSPFVVTYDVSNTPFDPVRYSRASINVVADEKFLDVFSPEAQGTQVILTDITNSEILWVGYLTSNLLNMPDDLCGYDTFTLEAQDCLYTLQKYYYKTIGEKKSIVTFRQILGEIAEKCGLITDMYIDSSMMRENGTYIEMGELTISEQNFFSSDTDEPWELNKVLEEICRYLGYTASQYKSCIYLFDMQSHTNQTWTVPDDATLSMNGFRYRKATNWTAYTQGSFTNLATGVTLRQSIVRGTGNDMSLEQIYNKVQVKDSFYKIDNFIPDVFKDEELTNRDGDFWLCKSLRNSGQLRYINKKGKSTKEETDESNHVYYIRKFDHEDYETIYRDPSTLSVVTPDVPTVKVITVEQNQVNPTYSPDSGKYTVTATFKNTSNSTKSVKVHAELRYDWYDGYHNMPDYNSNSNTSPSVSIPAGSSTTITVEVETWYDSAYTCSSSYGAWYTIGTSTTQYPLSNNNDATSKYVGATITDLATFDKPMDDRKYNYETESNISFNRYIMVHQCDKPERMHPYSMWLFEDNQVPLKDSEIESVFPAIFRLKPGYVNPIILVDKSYLALDAAAIYERYNLEYINPDWTDENSSMGMGLGLFIKTSNTTTISPALIFKLKIGNKYYSSQSGWTTTDSCFVVNLGTDKTDDDDTDFTGWWNETHPALNNIEWTEWSGVKGYKIPLPTDLDLSGDIGFWIMMPSKIQEVKTQEAYDGMNNYCWIEDFAVELATKMQLNYDLSDVLYENVIDSGSTNTLSDITCRITTYPGEGANSYSIVALDGVVLDKMIKVGLDNIANKPEENILKTYVNQYNTPTIKQTLTLQSYISPFSKIKDNTFGGKYFGILGTTIDYAKDSQRLTLVELKPWNS